MSAFVVDRAHIDVLVQLASRGRFRYAAPAPSMPGQWRSVCPAETPDEVGRMLLAQNIRSVGYRYPSDQPDELPGFEAATYAYRRTNRELTAVVGLKAIRCYVYQASEDPDWHDTEAAAFCEQLTVDLIGQLPGYDEAPWEWTEGEAHKAWKVAV